MQAHWCIYCHTKHINTIYYHTSLWSLLIIHITSAMLNHPMFPSCLPLSHYCLLLHSGDYVCLSPCHTTAGSAMKFHGMWRQSAILIGMFCRDQSRYVPSQWETSLQCYNVSHWLGAYQYWSLVLVINKNVYSESFMMIETERKVQLCNHHCTCWWPGTIWCQVISIHSDDYYTSIKLTDNIPSNNISGIYTV